MKSNIDINQLAIRYFNGTITPEEETHLLAFVKESEAQRRLFRQWEKDWERNHIVSASTEQAWSRHQALMQDALEDVATSPRRWSRWVAVAASVVLLVWSQIAP